MYKVAAPEHKKFRALMDTKKVTENSVLEALALNKDELEHVIRGAKEISEDELTRLVNLFGDEIRHVFTPVATEA